MNLEPEVAKKKSFHQKFLDGIERAGNKLPDPVTLFVVISAIILICSAVFAGTTAVNPANGEKVAVVNLLNKAGFIRILTNLPKNLVDFPPFALVITIMLGIGICDSTGLLKTLITSTVIKAPKKLILPIIAFIGIIANMAGDVGFVVLPPLAAMMFLSLKRHPIAGMVAAYAAIAGGFTANLLINTTEVILLGFTQPAANTVAKDWVGNPAFNYYFMAVSTFLLIPVVYWVTNKIVEPRLGQYEGEYIETQHSLTVEEKRGLTWSGIAALLFLIVLGLLTIPQNAVLRHPETGSLIVLSPFLFALVPIIALFFFSVGIAYGFGSKVLKNDKDVAAHLIDSMKPMSGFIVFAFVAGQMIAWFSWSNLGPIVAIKGAEFLKGIGFTGLPLILAFILIAAFINLLIASNSAKWAILAPVFVPMFMLLGVDPAGTTIAYRIADSITNPITPMMAYFAMILTFARQYKKDFGMGSMIAAMLPYTIAFSLMWILQLVVWYVFNLPIGPNFYFHM